MILIKGTSLPIPFPMGTPVAGKSPYILQFCWTTTKVSFPSIFLHTVLTYHFDFTGGARKMRKPKKGGKKAKVVTL